MLQNFLNFIIIQLKETKKKKKDLPLLRLLYNLLYEKRQTFLQIIYIKPFTGILNNCNNNNNAINNHKTSLLLHEEKYVASNSFFNNAVKKLM